MIEISKLLALEIANQVTTQKTLVTRNVLKTPSPTGPQPVVQLVMPLKVKLLLQDLLLVDAPLEMMLILIIKLLIVNVKLLTKDMVQKPSP